MADARELVKFIVRLGGPGMGYAPSVAVDAPRTATVVLAGYAKQERDFLQKVFNDRANAFTQECDWVFQTRDSVAAVLALLRRDRIPVILCDEEMGPDGWKELLDRFGLLSHPPCLIVTSRLADDYLWAEALNLGAYDVLARPFDRAEVVRTVSQARLHWQNGSNRRAAAARTVA